MLRPAVMLVTDDLWPALAGLVLLLALAGLMSWRVIRRPHTLPLAACQALNEWLCGFG